MASVMPTSLGLRMTSSSHAPSSTHDLLDMNDVFESKEGGGDDDAMMDPVLMQDTETICQTLHQICELEQKQAHELQTGSDSFEWIKPDSESLEIRAAETTSSANHHTPLMVVDMSSNRAVEEALYGDDDDDDCDMMGGSTPTIKLEDVDAPLTSSDAAALLTDAELPNILDMFTSMYADQPAVDDDDESNLPKYNPLSIHIPTPISIPQYQPMQHPTVTYNNTKLLAPHSTPNIPFSTPVYFNHPSTSSSQPPQHPMTQSYHPSLSPNPNACRPFAAHGHAMAYPASALISPTYHGPTGARLCCPKSKTPKALPRFTLSPDIAEQKLMRIFFHYCDPVAKSLSLSQLMAMLTKHRIKEDMPLNLSVLFPPNEATTTTNPFPYSLFRTNDSTLSLDDFQNAFQICNRCTEMKRKQVSAQQQQCKVVVSALAPRDMMEDIAPVIVRVVPMVYEGPKIKSCDHFQWTWCEGFDKTGNEKCNGTNRHDKCPKYLANCTLWKHRLPPKNRKSKDMEDSPAKKLKFFS
ncbi:Aste57867_8186 [Aphanomyces stellatus]|uniref:Aste57867_8186 protein n=1 Tax=Aphanomyces stellatus TaxID=120398 RepID=A0A485KJK9_9STRA|nr:hypothetical protein As57867_008155 [Aphanomyces stellatus]VFT85074.1 Aste57867_8186 [Aphanomyces stellatus]